MKKIIFLFVFAFLVSIGNAQKQYSVLGETYELKSEISGTLELLWNVIDGEYRYFAKKGDAIVELTNTRGSNNRYQEEYKTILQGITPETNMNTDKLNLTLPSLRNFFRDYNAFMDPNYSVESKEAKVEGKMLVFGGVTNNPFINNLDNSSNPVFGLEVEVYESNNLPRHSIYLQLKHAAKGSDFKYSNTQIGIGYRFRFINSEAVSFYANVIAATYSFSKNETTVEATTLDLSENNFHAPFYFGIGTDIKVSDNSFVTLAYDELFALNSENQGNFSTHITIGYKFNL